MLPDNFKIYMNPYLGSVLSSLQMDKRFVKGEGCYLFDDQGNRYLDFIAAFGCLSLGHNSPEIWDAILQFHQTQSCTFIQPSELVFAGELAKRLISIAPKPLKYVTYANSGSEAVETAIKICRSATKRVGILSTWNSFHGKTLAALSATGRSAYHTDFGVPFPGFTHIPYGDSEALEKILITHPSFFSALIVEPIQGEGGIVVPPKDYLKKARKLCDQFDVLLILDEVQTGLGRTGLMFACEREGVTPDVMCLAKGLGGGLMPIGACLLTEKAYSQNFALKHSSTFSGGGLAACAGIAVIQTITANNNALLHHVTDIGTKFKEALNSLQLRFPHIIRSIRGHGFFLGVEFSLNPNEFNNSPFLSLSEQERLTPLISSYLLNQEGLRVAPTLNGHPVIRIEPPLIATWDHCLFALKGIENALHLISEGNIDAFL